MCVPKRGDIEPACHFDRKGLLCGLALSLPLSFLGLSLIAEPAGDSLQGSGIVELVIDVVEDPDDGAVRVDPPQSPRIVSTLKIILTSRFCERRNNPQSPTMD